MSKEEDLLWERVMKHSICTNTYSAFDAKQSPEFQSLLHMFDDGPPKPKRDDEWLQMAVSDSILRSQLKCGIPESKHTGNFNSDQESSSSFLQSFLGMSSFMPVTPSPLGQLIFISNPKYKDKITAAFSKEGIDIQNHDWIRFIWSESAPTSRRKVTFPNHRFTEYESKDEVWAVPLGIAKVTYEESEEPIIYGLNQSMISLPMQYQVPFTWKL